MSCMVLLSASWENLAIMFDSSILLYMPFANVNCSCLLQPSPGSPSLQRWDAESSPVLLAAPSVWSVWPAATHGLTSRGWRTISPSCPMRLGRTRRRSGHWTWRIWSQRIVGNTPAECLTKLGRSMRLTKLKWSVSAASMVERGGGSYQKGAGWVKRAWFWGCSADSWI